jgi:hypothetical protein
MAAQIQLPDGTVATYNGEQGWDDFSDDDPKVKVMLEYFTEKAIEAIGGRYHPYPATAIAREVAGMIVGARVVWEQPTKPSEPDTIY